MVNLDNTRLKHILILAAASLIVAAACFYLGGIIADVSGVDKVTGIKFSAGGALAGYAISFLILFIAYRNIGGTSLILKVTVKPRTGEFTRAGNTFKAKTTRLKHASGERAELEADAIWEAGGLTIHLRDIEQDDLVMIFVTDSNGGKWESDFFSPLCPSISLI